MRRSNDFSELQITLKSKIDGIYRFDRQYELKKQSYSSPLCAGMQKILNKCNLSVYDIAIYINPSDLNPVKKVFHGSNGTGYFCAKKGRPVKKNVFIQIGFFVWALTGQKKLYEDIRALYDFSEDGKNYKYQDKLTAWLKSYEEEHSRLHADDFFIPENRQEIDQEVSRLVDDYDLTHIEGAICIEYKGRNRRDIKELAEKYATFYIRRLRKAQKYLFMFEDLSKGSFEDIELSRSYRKGSKAIQDEIKQIIDENIGKGGEFNYIRILGIPENIWDLENIDCLKSIENPKLKAHLHIGLGIAHLSNSTFYHILELLEDFPLDILHGQEYPPVRFTFCKTYTDINQMFIGRHGGKGLYIEETNKFYTIEGEMIYFPSAVHCGLRHPSVEEVWCNNKEDIKRIANTSLRTTLRSIEHIEKCLQTTLKHINPQNQDPYSKVGRISELLENRLKYIEKQQAK